MDPLTIGLIAGGAYLLSKGLGTGASAAEAAEADADARLSSDQLVAKYRGAVIVNVPQASRRRLQQLYDAALGSRDKTVLVPTTAANYSAQGGQFKFYIGKAPGNVWGDWGTYGGAPGDVFMLALVNAKKQSVFSKVVAPIVRVAAPIIGTIVGGPAGTAAGAAASKALSGYSPEQQEFEDFRAYMMGSVKRGPRR